MADCTAYEQPSWWRHHAPTTGITRKSHYNEVKALESYFVNTKVSVSSRSTVGQCSWIL